MRRLPDLLTADLFDVPQPAPATPGGMACGREIAHVMSDALKACPHDRIEVAARMTRLLGKEISLSMLNAYTAESAELGRLDQMKAEISKQERAIKKYLDQGKTE